MNKTIDLKKVRTCLETKKDRSAWDKGVTMYALDLLSDLEEWNDNGELDSVNLRDISELRPKLLNGANDWKHYSYSGSALVNNCKIAERLCNPSTLKRVDGGNKEPSRIETWLDVQANALAQAFYVLMWALRKAAK